jgi:hypothetical protein
MEKGVISSCVLGVLGEGCHPICKGDDTFLLKRLWLVKALLGERCHLNAYVEID